MSNHRTRQITPSPGKLNTGNTYAQHKSGLERRTRREKKK